jgi:hypothetical protein
MTVDIFDTCDTSDLPKGFVATQLKIINVRDDTKLLLELFEKKNELSIDEILVALYRAHNIQKTRTWVSGTAYNLSIKGLIKKVDMKKGIYIKI